MHPIVRAHAHRAIEHHVRPDHAARTDDHIRADDRERPDSHIRGKLRLRRYDGTRIDHDAAPAVTAAAALLAPDPASGATIISAWQTSTPSTSAAVENFQMPFIARSSVAVSTSWSPGSTGFLKRALSMPTKKKRVFSSGITPAVMNARMPAVCASASMIITPGITGRCGKWPGKNGSLYVTFLSARMLLPFSHSITRSTSRKG